MNTPRWTEEDAMAEFNLLVKIDSTQAAKARAILKGDPRDAQPLNAVFQVANNALHEMLKRKPD